MEAAEADPELRQLIRATCQTSLRTWAQDWCWAYDPRLVGMLGLNGVIPFVHFPKQVELLDWIQEVLANGDNGLIEKSREMGVSYILTQFAQWGWQYVDGFSFAFGSRKLDMADTLDDPDSLLEKVRINIRMQPAFLLPRGFQIAKHSKHKLIINPANGNTLSAEGGDDQGRGGRKTARCLDEYASQPRAKRIDAAVSNTCRSVFYVSTPKGMGNDFAHKRFSGKLPVFTISYKDDPRKDELWLQEQWAKWDALTVEQEILLNYSATVEGVAIPADWVRAAVYRGSAPVHPGHRVAGLDVADGGTNLNVYIARQGPVTIRVVDWRGIDITSTGHTAAREADSDGCERLQYDRVGVGAGISVIEHAEPPYRCRPVGLNAGDAPTNNLMRDNKEHRANVRFLNAKAEWWWGLRLRFQATWETLTGVRRHPPDDCIWIPDDPVLIAQLSLPRWEQTDRGKLKLESKKSLKSRGIESPDHADSLALAYAEPEIFEIRI